MYEYVYICVCMYIYICIYMHPCTLAPSDSFCVNRYGGILASLLPHLLRCMLSFVFEVYRCMKLMYIITIKHYYYY